MKNTEITREAKRIEEDCLYSSKSHYFAGHTWKIVHIGLGGLSAVLSAVASASILSNLSKGSLLAGVLGLFITALTSIMTFVNPNKLSDEHSKAGKKYNALRNDARIFHRVIVVTQTDEKELVKKLLKLNERRTSLNTNSPLIPKWAFLVARKGIEQGEAEFVVDK